MKSKHIVQLLVWVFMVGIIVVILVENVKLRRRIHVDFEQYRTQMHKAIKKAISADCQEHPALALAKNMTAQGKVQVMAELVGGAENLTILSGLDIADVQNSLCKGERDIRAVAIQKGILPPHPLNQKSCFEHPTRPPTSELPLAVD